MENFVRSEELEKTIKRLYNVNSISREDSAPLIYSITHEFPDELLCSLLSHVVPAFLTNLQDEDSEIVVYIHSAETGVVEIYISRSQVPIKDVPEKL